MKLEGVHHVTCITGDAPANVEFYAGELGLRMVKETVNQDEPRFRRMGYADHSRRRLRAAYLEAGLANRWKPAHA